MDPLVATAEETTVDEPAWEIKFLLPGESAAPVEAWARAAMTPDPHGDPAYEVTTLYLDTPRMDLFHRAREFERGTIRVRTYGAGGPVFLERKRRRRDRVRKRRTGIPAAEVGRLAAPPAAAPWAGDWFRDEVEEHGYRPVCAVAFRRTAFVGGDGGGEYRLTVDRGIRCAPASAWEVPSVPAGASPVGIPGDGAVCELKFREAMPPPFKALAARLGLEPAGLSKYRRACRALGLADG